MALVASGWLHHPLALLAGGLQSITMATTTVSFDSTTDRLAWVGRAYQTDSIAKINFRCSAAATPFTVEVRIETVSNGRPTGTLWAANTNGTVVTGVGWKTVTLTAAASVTPGQEFAIVFVWSATSSPSSTFTIAGGNLLITSMSGHYPVGLQDTGGGTWGALSTNGPYCWIVEMTTAGVVSFPGLVPVDTGVITAFNNGTNPNERAMKFISPMKCRAIGMRVAMFNIAAGADFTFSLWDSTDNPGAAPTPLAQTASQDGDFALSTTQDGYVDLFFSAPYTLVAGTTYYLGVRPDTANSIGLGELTTATVTNAIRAFGIGVITAHLSTRQWVGTDPGAWTDTTTTLPLISLILDQLDDGTGGGGESGRIIGG